MRKNKIVSFFVLCILLLSSIQTVHSDNISVNRDILIVFDASGSMEYTTQSGERKIDVAKDAVNDFLGELTSDDRVALCVFYGCDDIQIEADFTYNHNLVSNAIKYIESDSGTPIEDALLHAWEYLKINGDKDHLWYIVIFTDGREECYGDPCSAAEVISSESQKYTKTPVFTVGFLIDPTSQAERDLECIAQKSGGKYFPAPSPEELEEALKKVAEEILDSDGDGVPDNVDKCPDTPKNASIIVDEDGCIQCLDALESCGLKIMGVIPYIGAPVNLLNAANDFCEYQKSLENDDDIGAVISGMAILIDVGSSVLSLIPNPGTILINLVTAVTQCVEGIIRERLDEWCGGYTECLDFLFDTFQEKLLDFTKRLSRDIFFFVAHSPVDIEIYDSHGNIVTKDQMEFPGYIIEYQEGEIGFVLDPEGNYRIKVIGKENGEYSLDIGVISKGEEVKIQKYKNVQIKRGETQTYYVTLEKKSDRITGAEITKGRKLDFNIVFVLAAIFSIFIAVMGIIFYLEKKKKKL